MQNDDESSDTKKVQDLYTYKKQKVDNKEVDEMDVDWEGKKNKGAVAAKVDADLIFKTPIAAPTKERIILWLRNDLRLHDNYVMVWAMQRQCADKEIVPVYCFDPRYFELSQSKTKYGTRKTGVIRARFQLETVEALRTSLEAIGSQLIVALEKPEDYLVKLLDTSGRHNILVFQQEITSEELKIEKACVERLRVAAG